MMSITANKEISGDGHALRYCANQSPAGDENWGVE
jgi:hypothetical protein